MAEPVSDRNGTATEWKIDDNGVDRTQIRRMLALSHQQRLQQLQEFMDSVEEIWRLNGIRPVR